MWLFKDTKYFERLQFGNHCVIATALQIHLVSLSLDFNILGEAEAAARKAGKVLRQSWSMRSIPASDDKTAAPCRILLASGRVSGAWENQYGLERITSPNAHRGSVKNASLHFAAPSTQSVVDLGSTPR
ncbi:hypothetical protein PZ897_19805 [Hoeflea sp. YIM 152468]|uniref:hypothetical protein n=1 Tax=Hoeflea sp. YIM 152468 TaxID=3031759 RepID=UPI0023DB7B90|nr:hypothetical protein [Hoeflea sp. YIM 152468]MDF1610432.1 hypothetical protein [Hoeflea sp. YIM 152468]